MAGVAGAAQVGYEVAARLLTRDWASGGVPIETIEAWNRVNLGMILGGALLELAGVALISLGAVRMAGAWKARDRSHAPGSDGP